MFTDITTRHLFTFVIIIAFAHFFNNLYSSSFYFFPTSVKTAIISIGFGKKKPLFKIVLVRKWVRPMNWTKTAVCFVNRENKDIRCLTCTLSFSETEWLYVTKRTHFFSQRWMRRNVCDIDAEYLSTVLRRL